MDYAVFLDYQRQESAAQDLDTKEFKYNERFTNLEK
jgi:hypothetical protein